VGFRETESVLPYPEHSFPGYRILQEYFVLPQKFLFLDINGWEKWTNRGEATEFRIVFELDDLPMPPPKISNETFLLFATPAINVFSNDADPILLDHHRNEYRVRPSGSNQAHYQVYSVENVSGYRQGSVEAREYDRFEMFQVQSKDRPIYHVSFKKSPIGNIVDALLSFTYPTRGEKPVTETLSIKIICTNGELAERLQVGDISQSTSTSPALLEFRNIRPPTSSVLPPLGKILLWRFLSLYSLNYLSLAQTENIQALLKLYIFPESKDQAATYANTRRVEGIAGVEVESEDRLIKGYLMRGQEIKVKMQSDHFAGDGDLFLFGSMLDHFFASYASINSFTRFKVEELLKGDTYTWPARVGDRPLI
jgi:type VI secretion system protein ImpG